MPAHHLTSQLCDRLGKALGEVSEAKGGLASTAQTAVGALSRMIPGDSVVMGYRRHSDGVYYGFAQPLDYPVGDYGEVYQRFVHEHPFVEHFKENPTSGAVRLGDVVRRSNLERRTLYGEFFRPLGVCELLGRVVPVPELAEWSFGESDGAFSYPTSPSPYKRAVLAVGVGRSSGSFSNEEVAAFDLFTTSVAGQFMRELRWELAQRQLNRNLPDPLAALHVLASGRQPTSVATVAAMAKLTPRETEVLYWLAEGKTNPEIGQILELSPRTVQSHVIAIFGKLGVETRLAAARMVWCAAESLGVPS